MKLNKIMLATAITLGSLSLANAADETPAPAPAAGNQGGGQINFSGSIIDAPCSIASESLTQDVQLGAISNALLTAQKHSTPVNINIKLQDCVLGQKDKKDTVTVTFTGTASADEKLLGITDNKSDVGIMFEDKDGNTVDLNKASSATALANGVGNDKMLNFKAYVKATSASTPTITPGNFTAVANFKLAYE